MTRALATALGAYPLRAYLRGEAVAVNDITEALRDAAADAQRRINKLETKSGIGSVVRRAQLAIVKRELRAVQDALWKEVNRSVRRAGPRIADAAKEAEDVLQEVLFTKAGRRPSPALIAAQTAYARRSVLNYFARGQNGIPLSQRVYRTSQLARGYVDRQINRSVLQGEGWQTLAARVKPMIDPSTPGGVSYAAKRLARTELNNAFHTTQRELAEVSPFVEKLQWHISRSHPKEDECDLLDGRQFVPSELPKKPHPQCLCYTTNVTMSDEDFLDFITDPTNLDNLTDHYSGKRTA